MTLAEYQALVGARKACRRCPALINPAVACGGRFDSETLGPWTDWHGDLAAVVMVVGQDWGDVSYFEKTGGIDNPKNPTNVALNALLTVIGFPIGTSRHAVADSRVFLTNAILCLKDGGLQRPVKRKWFANCGNAFLRPIIDMVQPRVAVCLGEQSYRGVMSAFSFSVRGTFRQAVENPTGSLLTGGTRAFAVYHCGRLVQNTHRPLALQRADWQRIRPYVQDASP